MEKADLAQMIDKARTAFKAGSVPTEGDFHGLIDAVENGAFVKGMIMMFAGRKAEVPTGWALCDGSHASAPDLSGRFVVGEDTAHMGTRQRFSPERMTFDSPHFAVKTNSFNARIVGSTAPTTLTTRQLPSHNHQESITWAAVYEDGTFATKVPGAFRYESTPRRVIQGHQQEPASSLWVAKLDLYDKSRILGNRISKLPIWEAFRTFTTVTSSEGHGEGHSHHIEQLRITPDEATNFTVSLPYYALAFIMKL